MRFVKPLAAALALTIGATSLVGTADARHRWHRHHHDHGDSLGAGILGFAAGALLSGAFAGPRYYRSYDYHQPAPVYRTYRTAPVYYGRPDPWTQEWYAYCSVRYRSFNSETGYFLGFDGNYHLCE